MARRLAALAVAVAALLAALAPAPTGAAASGSGPTAHSAAKKKCSHKARTKAAKRWHRRHCRKKQGEGPGEVKCANTSESPGRLSAQEDETPVFLIKLSKTTIGCGKVIVEQQNIGEDPHDLVLQKAGDAPSYYYPELGPGLTARQTVDLSRGSWLLYCDLPGHREAGMERTLTVD